MKKQRSSRKKEKKEEGKGVMMGNHPYKAIKKKHLGKTAIFHSKNLLGEAPKNLKKSLGKSIQTQNHTSFYWKNLYKKKH